MANKHYQHVVIYSILSAKKSTKPGQSFTKYIHSS